VPGNWVWNGERYVWRAGYWARVQPGYVWVPAHYRWTPYGYIYVAGYWDYAVAQRGLLYAPVVVDTVVVGPRFVYTPVYAVPDVVVMDAFFVRPAYCHYYFGDYYGPRYQAIGFESVVVYSRRSYDPIITYQRYEYRDNPRWLDVQVNLVVARDAGKAPLPPRTLVQQNTIIQQNITNVTNNTTIINNNVNKTTVVNNNVVIAPAAKVAAAQGLRTVPLDATTRAQVQQQAQTAQQAAVTQRRQAETPPAPGARPAAPRTAALHVPPSGLSAARTAVPNPGGAKRSDAAAPAASATKSPSSRPPMPNSPNATAGPSGLRAPPGGVVMPGQASHPGPGGTLHPGQTKGPMPTAKQRPPQHQPPPPSKGGDSKEKPRPPDR
jgi:hypothetical protein